MTKLKLSTVEDEKPVKLAITIPAELYRNLVAYAQILARESGKAVEPAKLIAPMVEKFIASDRAFAKFHRQETKARLKPSTPMGVASQLPLREPS